MAISLTSKASTTKTVMLQMDTEVYARIKLAAKQHNIPASAAIRQILEQGITEIEAASAA